MTKWPVLLSPNELGTVPKSPPNGFGTWNKRNTRSRTFSYKKSHYFQIEAFLGNLPETLRTGQATREVTHPRKIPYKSCSGQCRPWTRVGIKAIPLHSQPSPTPPHPRPAEKSRVGRGLGKLVPFGDFHSQFPPLLMKLEMPEGGCETPASGSEVTLKSSLWKPGWRFELLWGALNCCGD